MTRLNIPVRALLAEAIVVHVSAVLQLPATARRAALACARLAEEVVTGIPADAVDPVDVELPEDVADPAAWARLALGTGAGQHGDDDNVAGPTT